MTLPAALAVVAALVAASALLALWLTRRSGRVRVPAETVTLTSADLGAPLGETATLVQFGTRFCAPCRQAARRLSEFAATHPGVTHLDIDLEADPDWAWRHEITESPTTFVLGPSGQVRARITGVPRPADLATHLTPAEGGLAHAH
jgi:thiol-disulfide isomerase/thioredoxin